MFVTSTVGFSSARWPSDRPAGHGGEAARRELEVRLPREHVDGVRIDEPAVVVANVDDDAFRGAVLGVEIHIQLRECLRAHVLHVHVAEPAVADLLDVGAAPFDPIAVDEPALRRQVDRPQHDVARRRRVGGRPHRERHAAIDLLSKSESRFTCGADARVVHREHPVARLDAGERRGAQRDHLAHAQSPALLVLGDARSGRPGGRRSPAARSSGRSSPSATRSARRS